MKNELGMSIDDLAKWHLNFLRRVEIAKELECTNEEGKFEWKCCTAHQALRNEEARIMVVALRLKSSGEDGRPLSPNWWRSLGRDDVADHMGY